MNPIEQWPQHMIKEASKGQKNERKEKRKL